MAWLSGRAPLRVDLVRTEFLRTDVSIADQFLRAEIPLDDAAAGPSPAASVQPSEVRYFHVELQTAGDSEMPLRMAQYWGHAFRRFSKLEAGPVRVSSTVIYLDRKQFRPDPGAFEANDGEGTSGLFGYRVLRLWELDAKAFLRSARPGLAPFAPLMSTRDPAGTVAQSKQKIIEAGPEEATARKKAELCGALFALSGLVIDDRDLLFKLIWEDWMGLERSVTVQWLMERGEARGLEMGRAQLLEARREDVLAVLEASL